MKLAEPRGGLVRPLTIPALARQSGIPRRTLFRHLMDAHAADVGAGRDPAWLYRHNGPESAWCVNVPRLKLAHPELFGVPTPSELHEQLRLVEAYGRETRKLVNDVRAALRDFRGEHEGRHADVDRLLAKLRQALLGATGNPA